MNRIELSKKGKIVIFGGLAGLIVIIIAIVLIVRWRTHTHIQNWDAVETSATEEDKTRIESRLYNILSTSGLDTAASDIKIREDSYDETVEGTAKKVSFLVDSDALKQTYVISTELANGRKEFFEDVFVSCPDPEVSKYPYETCHGVDTSNEDLEFYLPHEGILSGGQTYKVLMDRLTPEEPFVLIKVPDVCGDEALAEEAKETAIGWVKNTLKLNPDNYVFEAPTYFCARNYKSGHSE